MRVLIVEANAELGRLWANHLRRQGHDIALVGDTDQAVFDMQAMAPAVILVDLDLPDGGAMSISDYAAYRHPEAKVIFVTAARFFSDGSALQLTPNACAVLPRGTAPADLAAVVEYHGSRDAAAG